MFKATFSLIGNRRNIFLNPYGVKWLVENVRNDIYNATLHFEFSNVFLIVVCWSFLNCKHIWAFCFQLILSFRCFLSHWSGVSVQNFHGREISHKTDDPHNWCHCQQDGLLLLLLHISLSCLLHWNSNSKCKRKSEM